jgi:hypothetical protein
MQGLIPRVKLLAPILAEDMHVCPRKHGKGHVNPELQVQAVAVGDVTSCRWHASGVAELVVVMVDAGGIANRESILFDIAG